MWRPDRLRVESQSHERLDRRKSSGSAERLSDAVWSGRRPQSSSPVLVLAITVSAVVEVGTSVRNLPCQTAGTEIGCRITSGDVPVVGGASSSWSFKTPAVHFACHLSCGSCAPLCLRPGVDSPTRVVSSERRVSPTGDRARNLAREREWSKPAMLAAGIVAFTATAPSAVAVGTCRVALNPYSDSSQRRPGTIW